MNRKTLIAVGLTALVAASSIAFAQAQKAAVVPADPRIDKLLEQNEKILKNQEEIFKKINEANEQLTVLRRRSS